MKQKMDKWGGEQRDSNNKTDRPLTRLIKIKREEISY